LAPALTPDFLSMGPQFEKRFGLAADAKPS
jgi:hypothetical protein